MRFQQLITLQIFLPAAGSSGGFLVVSVGRADSMDLLAFSFQLKCDLNSLMNLTGIHDVQVFHMSEAKLLFKRNLFAYL